jgi:UPF0755 protein
MKKLIFIATFLAVAVTVGAIAGGLWSRYQQFLESPLSVPEDGQVVLVEPGSTGGEIVRALAELELTRPGWEWRLLMRLEPHVYRAGEYRLDAGMAPREVLQRLASGQVVQYRITLVEGWTFRQFTEAIRSDPVLRHELDFSAPDVLSELGLELEGEHPEGWFLPETYQFTRGDSDRDILHRAHASMKDALHSAWQARAGGIPLESAYEMLILASIIEKETAIDEERDQIAGVFTRRLQRGMRLQTDPTVIYGMGESFNGDIRRRDLRADTPYNTYTRHGLPPTPIAMPGRASLRAAASPADGTSLYFVADGQGGHTFSDTLEQHQAAVRKLMDKN